MAFEADTIATAPLLTIPLIGQLNESYNTGGGDVDMFAVDLIGGRMYEFDSDGGNDSFLRIFDAFGTEVARQDDGTDFGEAAGTNPYLQFTANYSGRYYVAFSPYYLTNYDPSTTLGRTAPENSQITSTTTLIVSDFGIQGFPDSNAINSVAPLADNDETATLGSDGLPYRNEYTVERFVSSGDVEAGRWDLQKGDVLVVDINGREAADPLDSIIRVFDSAGTQIGFDNGGGSGEDSELVFAAPTGGAYYIAVTGEGNSTYNALTGADTLAGDTGTFTAIIHRNPTLLGTSGSNNRVGTIGNDYMALLAGADTASGGDGLDTLAGGDDNDYLAGGNGNDVLYGEAENDTLLGEAGNDVLSGSFGDDTLDGGADVDMLSGGVGDDNLSGGLGADTLDGGLGADTLDGGAGADSMTGGDGDEFYFVDDLGDVIVEAAGGASGFDYAYTSVSFTQWANVEYVLATGSAALTGTGDGSINAMDATLRFNGVSFSGLGGNDVLYGSNYADGLDGGADNDILLAFLSVDGADTLIGGAGDDVYYVFEADDVLTELGGGGFDTVYAYANITLAANIEQVLLVGAGTTATGNAQSNNIFGNNLTTSLTLDGQGGDDWIIGGTAGDTLIGGAGNDQLQGLAGANRLEGGADNDRYYSSSATDTIIELAAGGFDTLYASYNVAALAAEVEQLVLSGGATVANGNGLNNALYLNNNTVGVSADAGAGNDVIYGSGFADTLIGGIGNDTMAGGAGADRFTWNAAGNMGADRITDFADGADLMVLTGMGYTAGSIGGAITIGGGANALVTFASGTLAGTTITLLGINQASISAADFVF